MLATNDNSVEIGCSQSSTSFADIIINNDNAVADGLISGFAQFVHDPKYLKEFVSVFNRQMIPEKFADAVINRRIDTQELNNIWDFPLNLTCPATVPVPWTIVDATVKGFTGVAELEFARFSFTFKLGGKCTSLIGDVNWDGEVNSDDAALICDYDAELVDASELHMCVGDVTGEGDVNSDDAAWICDYDAELVEYSDFPVFNS